MKRPSLLLLVIVGTCLVVLSGAQASTTTSPPEVAGLHLPPISSLPVGQMTLVAFRSSPASPWLTLGNDLDAAHGVTVSNGYVTFSGAAATGPATASPQSGIEFGCTATGLAPVQTGTNLQGKVKFTACINIAKTYARICVVDNDTYNNQACQDNYHTGNLNWTAYSWVLDCLGVYRKWASSAPMIEYTATDGEQDIWAGQGPWYGPYTC